MAERGLRHKKRLGQNFLTDDAIVGKILKLAEVKAQDQVIEVGPGIGTLTLALRKTGATVCPVEVDPELAPLTHALNYDALAIDSYRDELPQGEVKLVSNLPYNLGATILLSFFQELPQLKSATVMLQSEVVERIKASPGQKNYGAYTVKLALLSKVVGSFKVAPSCFSPPPHVLSTVVRLDRRDDLHLSAQSYSQACKLAEAAFAHRRKTIFNSMKTYFDDAAMAASALAALKIDPSRRAESIAPEGFVIS
ncbi:MAG: 16S rRNA (adenine(1518)-N(6)/adenine(1519)-N(6))-dimethyltransferase RsmA [Coriobacteriales bacterium]|nr:16S rRNA (adenine(1518)-N(6)/adenine(1519)-N(6))-dimethyltransferase RsmA [Coriobacteriales bacterium]